MGEDHDSPDRLIVTLIVIAFCSLFLWLGTFVGEVNGHEDLGKMICRENGNYTYKETKCEGGECTVVCKTEQKERYDGGYIKVLGDG